MKFNEFITQQNSCLMENFSNSEGENFINNLRATKLLKWLPFTVLSLSSLVRASA